MTIIAATINSTPIIMTRRTLTQSRRQQQWEHQSNKNGNSSDIDENSNNNYRYKIVSVNQVLTINTPYKSSGKNEAKRYFRHSPQRSVSMAPLSLE